MNLPSVLLRPTLCSWAALAVSAAAVNPIAADAAEPSRPRWEYFSIDIAPSLENIEAKHIVSDRPIAQSAWRGVDRDPRVVVPDGSEAYLLAPVGKGDLSDVTKIVGKKRAGQAIEGQYFVLRETSEAPGNYVLARFPFQVEAASGSNTIQREFLRAKGEHFERLWSQQFAGAAMFRHQATRALGEIGQDAEPTGSRWGLARRDGVDDTIQLISGGRAVSENLQLDRQLPTTAQEGEMVRLSEITGITVREIDWSTWLSEQPTELDPLSKMVPHDQHALFMPSFDTLAELIQSGTRLALPAVQWIEPQSRQTDVLGFYQQQLGLPLNQITRQLGGALIDEIAVTGSDPYFRTGTDVAVLMSSQQPELLSKSIETLVAGQAATKNRVSRMRHNVDGHQVTEWSSRNRHFCSLIVTIGDTCVVSNSLTQVRRIIQAASGNTPTLASLDEYRFFRQRYPRKPDDRSSLLIISDATIRRWCGPAWRIAASRRTRARATIAEMTMQHAEPLITETLEKSRPLTPPSDIPGAGRLWLRADGVHSMQYGTLQFQTPIAEMDMKFASQGEVDLYENWRRRYERQWRNSFDPIAVSFTVADGNVSADLSVIPLMVRSQYRWWLNWVGSARIRPNTGDQHPETMASLQLAIDTESTSMSLARSMLSQQGGDLNLLSWIDGSISIYLDRDQEWIKRVMGQPEFADTDNPFERERELMRDAPIGVFIPSRDNFRMTAFVVALRGLLDQFAPNMIRWQSDKHEGVTFVSGTILENTPVGDADDLPRIYYVTTPEGLTWSLNQNVITRAIDRHIERKRIAEKQKTPDADQLASDGEEDADPHRFAAQIAATMSGEGAITLARANDRQSYLTMARLSWSNLPILNYLRHQYPDRDPQLVYQQLLGERLVDPGGGQYHWVEKYKTYESTLYGHRLAPQKGPLFSPTIQPQDLVEGQLSFDDGGLRVKLNVTSKN